MTGKKLVKEEKEIWILKFFKSLYNTEELTLLLKYTHRIWFLSIVLYWKEPELLGEMTDSTTRIKK